MYNNILHLFLLFQYHIYLYIQFEISQQNQTQLLETNEIPLPQQKSITETKEQKKYSRKLHFLLTVLSLTSFLSYTCLVAQTNVWKFYYGEDYQSILRGLIGIILNQYVSPSYIVYAHLGYQTFFYIIIGLFKFIDDKNVKYVLTLIPTAISASFCTIFYGVILSTATRISKQHAQTVSFGNGIQGIIFMVLQIILALCYKISDKDAEEYESQISGVTIIYYTIAAVLCVVCIILWAYFIKIAPQVAKPVAQVKWQDIILDKNHVEDAKQKLNLWQVVKQIIPMTISVFLNYITMFMLMPQFYLQIRQQKVRDQLKEDPSKSVSNDPMWNLMVMLTHYIGDWVGKTIPVWKKFSNLFTPLTSMLLVYLRVIIFVVVILLMVYPVKDPVIQSDACVYISILINDILYGLSETECWIHYQDQLKDQLERQTAAFWLNMVSRLAIGLAGLINLFTIKTFNN